MIKNWQKMKDLEGRHVRVWLELTSIPVSVDGVLLMLDQEGEVLIRTENGDNYAWPALGMEVLDE
jgi:hypothetical protein